MPTHVYNGDRFSLRASVDHFGDMPTEATLGELIELSVEVVVLEYGKDPYIRSKCTQPLDGESKTKEVAPTLSH